jgi:hypothetical protein
MRCFSTASKKLSTDLMGLSTVLGGLSTFRLEKCVFSFRLSTCFSLSIHSLPCVYPLKQVGFPQNNRYFLGFYPQFSPAFQQACPVLSPVRNKLSTKPEPVISRYSARFFLFLAVIHRIEQVIHSFCQVIHSAQLAGTGSTEAWGDAGEF